MKPLRICAVISSILLVGGYVYYQSRAQPSPATAPSSQPTLTAGDEGPIMSSSKSLSPVIRDRVTTTQATTRSLTLMPGSKSAPVFHDDGEAPATQPSTTQP